jgi:hypothetical protein
MTTDQEIAEALDVALFYKAQCAMLAEALEFYMRNADCPSSVGFGVCRCAFCKGEPAARSALEQHKKALKERE